jgi:hypothetical protein
LKLGLALAAAMVMSCLIAGGDVGSFLINGDFEEGEEGKLPGWSRSFYPRRDGIERCLLRTDDRARSGRWSLKVDTESVLGEETTLVFNGAVAKEITRMRGKRAVLSGWVYVEPGTAVRPISMRLRTFGRDENGRSIFLGDVLSVKVLGKPGEWVQFRAQGTVGTGNITSMDLHCSIRPDMVRTVQFLDDIRLELWTPPPLEILPLRETVWRDESVLPVEIRLNEEKAKTIQFELCNDREEIVRRWTRQAKRTIFGLPMPKVRLPEGSYLLRARLLDDKGNILVSDDAPIEVVESPWEDMPETPPRRKTTDTQHKGEMPEGFKVVGTVAPTSLPDALPEHPEMISPDLDLLGWRERGYVVFSRHYLDSVSRLGRARPGEIGPVRIFASPGEYEPATISVWALRHLKGVRVTVSELTGEQAIIPANSVDVRVVRMIQGLPSFLEKRGTVDIPEGQTQTFWLTVHVPPDIKPGFYAGTIAVSPGNGRPAEVELLLRVLPLKLPPPPKGYGFWWKMDARWNGYYSKERDMTLEQMRKQFILLREHGCNMVSCYGMPRMRREEDGTVSFDFERDHWGHNRYSLADFLRLGRETGFLSSEVPIQYVGADSLHTHWIARALKMELDSSAFDEFYRDACRRIDRWAKGQGFTLAFACVDEIGNSSQRRRTALRFYRLAQEAGVLTSVTDNSMHGGVHLMGQRRFDGIIDMRLYNFITPEMIRHARESNDRLWLYNLGSGGWNAKRDRFVFGFFTERCGAEGYSQWAFQWPSGNVNPYEAAAAGKRSGYHYALPAPDGPLPTLALEGVREGIDDARYLTLLPPTARPAFLDDIEPFSTRISSYLGRHSGNFLDAKRWRIAREAMREDRD